MWCGCRNSADFDFKEELGRGAHGVVHRVVSKRDGKVYVIKQVSVKRMKEKQRRNAVAEVLILRRLSHPNIVQYFNCFVSNQTLCIVMEFAAKGDLYSIIESRRRSKKHYGERTLWRYFWQLCQVRRCPAPGRAVASCADPDEARRVRGAMPAQGLVHLHSKRIVHRDLKTLNIFLTEDGRIKVGALDVV